MEGTEGFRYLCFFFGTFSLYIVNLGDWTLILRGLCPELMNICNMCVCTTLSKPVRRDLGIPGK